MKSYKEIRKQYYSYLHYYYKSMTKGNFKDASAVYPKVFALAWVLNRDSSKDFARMLRRDKD